LDVWSDGIGVIGLIVELLNCGIGGIAEFAKLLICCVIDRDKAVQIWPFFYMILLCTWTDTLMHQWDLVGMHLLVITHILGTP
jgi:hypothetical protein